MGPPNQPSYEWLRYSEFMCYLFTYLNNTIYVRNNLFQYCNYAIFYRCLSINAILFYGFVHTSCVFTIIRRSEHRSVRNYYEMQRTYIWRSNRQRKKLKAG